MTAANAADPLGDINHPAWRIREELRAEAYAEGVRGVSTAMIGAVEALLQAPIDADALRAALTMLCQTWRTQNARRPAATVDATRAQSAAELLDQFLTALDTWAEQCGRSRFYSATMLRWFAARWLPAGEIPAPNDCAAALGDLADMLEDAQSTTVRAAAAEIDRLTAPEGT